jgi:hypothetical protein
VLAEIVRLDRAHHRPIAGDPSDSQAMKLVACSHQSMIWDWSRHVARLRSALRELFPAALAANEDLAAPDTARPGTDPDSTERLSRARIGAALTLANRRNVTARTAQIQALLHPLRRSHRLGPLDPDRRLTSKNLGCLCASEPTARCAYRDGSGKPELGARGR